MAVDWWSYGCLVATLHWRPWHLPEPVHPYPGARVGMALMKWCGPHFEEVQGMVQEPPNSEWARDCAVMKFFFPPGHQAGTKST